MFNKEWLLFLFKYLFFVCMMVFNYKFVLSFCDVSDIPFNLMLSCFSVGFGYELMLVLTVVEIIFFHYFTVVFDK